MWFKEDELTPTSPAGERNDFVIIIHKIQFLCFVLFVGECIPTATVPGQDAKTELTQALDCSVAGAGVAISGQAPVIHQWLLGGLTCQDVSFR